GQPALLAVERDMIGILLGDHMSQETRPGQSLGDGLRGLLRGGDMSLAVRAGVSTAPVLDDEQRRRPVIELFAALGADLGSWLAAVGAAAFDLGQLVEDRDAREVLGQSLPAVAAPLLLCAGSLFGSRISGGWGPLRSGRRRVVEGIGDQERLIGVESFGSRA